MSAGKQVVAYFCKHNDGIVLHVCPDNGKTAKEMMRLHKDDRLAHGLVELNEVIGSNLI
ncbi:MAG: hypothetical protein JRM77_06945 [Nitrososphaerota archaeon]|nr:hypothetical protein [Nitrososphaerota archaeon]